MDLSETANPTSKPGRLERRGFTHDLSVYNLATYWRRCTYIAQQDSDQAFFMMEAQNAAAWIGRCMVQHAFCRESSNCILTSDVQRQ